MMKQTVCLILFVYFCGVSSNENVDDLNYNEERSAYNRSYIIRPCPQYDVDCIRLVLAYKRLCYPWKKRVPEPHPFEQPVYIPHSNITLALKNAVVSGVRNYNIREFYINQTSRRLVLEVEFESVTFQTPKSYMIFHMKGKEPVVTGDYLTITYNNLSLTLVVSNLWKKPRTHVFAYINDPKPNLVLGNGFTPRDSEALQNYENVFQDLPTTLKESVLTKGPVVLSIFFKTVAGCALNHSRTQY